MTNCNEINQMMSQYIDCQLDGEALEVFEKHIAGCSDCRNELEQMLQIVELCTDISEDDLPDSFRSELHEKLVKAAKENNRKRIIHYVNRCTKAIAAAAAVVLIIITMRIFVNTNDSLVKNAAVKDDAGASSKIARDAEMKNGLAMESAVEPNWSRQSDRPISKQSDERSNDSVMPDRGSGDSMYAAGTKDNSNMLGVASTTSDDISILSAESIQAAVILTVDEPSSEIDNIKGLLPQYDASAEEVPDGSTEEARVAPDNNKQEDVQLVLAMGKEWYDEFVKKLSDMYGQENMVIQDEIQSEGNADTQDKLIDDKETVKFKIVLKRK